MRARARAHALLLTIDGHYFSTILVYRFTHASYDRSSSQLRREVTRVTFHATLDFVDRETENSPLRETDDRNRKLTVSRTRYVKRSSSIGSLFIEFIDSWNALPESHFQNRDNRLGQEASIDWSITRNGRAQRACESRAPRERSCWTVAHSRSAAARAHSRVRAKVLQVYTHAYVHTRIRARAGCKSLGMITADGRQPSVIAVGTA
jgi:hypothetical protein